MSSTCFWVFGVNSNYPKLFSQIGARIFIILLYNRASDAHLMDHSKDNLKDCLIV